MLVLAMLGDRGWAEKQNISSSSSHNNRSARFSSQLLRLLYPLWQEARGKQNDYHQYHNNQHDPTLQGSGRRIETNAGKSRMNRDVAYLFLANLFGILYSFVHVDIGIFHVIGGLSHLVLDLIQQLALLIRQQGEV